MEPESLTLVVLKEIRDEGKKTNERINETNARLEQLRDELSRRIVESEMRTASAITALAGTVGDLVAVIKQERDFKPRLEQCEKDIAQLKSRLPDA